MKKSNSMKNINYYKDVQEQISLYLDNALEPDQKQQFMDDVKQNPNMWKALEKEKTFRKMIKSKLKSPKLGPDFIENIKNKINHY